jgi:hypothetical protein
MFSAKRITLTSVATLAALSWTTSVIAADESSASASSPVAAVAGAATPSMASLSSAPATLDVATTRRNPFGSKPVTAAVLATKRGGDRVFNDAQLKGVVSDNQATNVVTGMNVISDGAFAGSAGLSTVIQNSGNNVLIQNATIVNVQLK